MSPDIPYRQIVHHGLTVEGYSRAAMQTFWRLPELKLGFDLGAQPWGFMGTPKWFVSHSHMDHLLALPAYVARRRMMKMEPPSIYLPENAVANVERLLRAFSHLDRGRLPCVLHGVAPGDEIPLSRELVVSVHETFHTLPSVGYVVWERRKKLKEEYLHLTPDEIRDLAVSGVEVSAERRTPKVAYLGDSTPQGFDANPAMYEAEILIFEMTFVARRHRRARIHKFGHIHLSDVVERREKFHNQLLIASHFSTRYHDREIESSVRQTFPDMMEGRLILWL
ncbi:MAG TPA: metal-dependent hydrolase [Planctomycetaceae bacterium]|nr:metal-dependent hydrolase [Planctomycetaceae bacterium]